MVEPARKQPVSHPAALISASVIQKCQAFGSCSVMLTGGRSAAQLYQAWSTFPEFPQLRKVHFFFGDERCVPPNHPDSNYGLAMRTLFKGGVPTTCKVTRMEADKVDRNTAALEYERQLPKAIDILLLSMGEDGHIASLFPHSPVMHETRRLVMSATAPKSPMYRLTITRPVLQRAREVFVLALGEQKRKVYEDAQRNPTDVDAIPARLVLNRNWILGDMTLPLENVSLTGF